MTNKEKFIELMNQLSGAHRMAFYEAILEKEPIDNRDRYGCNHKEKFSEICKVL